MHKSIIQKQKKDASKKRKSGKSTGKKKVSSKSSGKKNAPSVDQPENTDGKGGSEGGEKGSKPEA